MITFSEYHPSGRKLAAQTVAITARTELLLTGIAGGRLVNILIDGSYYCVHENDFDLMSDTIEILNAEVDN